MCSYTISLQDTTKKKEILTTPTKNVLKPFEICMYVFVPTRRYICIGIPSRIDDCFYMILVYVGSSSFKNQKKNSVSLFEIVIKYALNFYNNVSATTVNFSQEKLFV